jgi:hypothetical protein
MTAFKFAPTCGFDENSLLISLLAGNLGVETGSYSRFQTADLLPMLRDGISPPHHQSTPTGGRQGTPRRALEGGFRGRDSGTHLIPRAQSERTPHRSGRRVVG